MNFFSLRVSQLCSLLGIGRPTSIRFSYSKRPSRASSSAGWAIAIPIDGKPNSSFILNCLIAGFTSFFSDLAPALGSLHAAKVLHSMLLENVLRAPMTMFDTTPVGRILSRFSKDVESVDQKMPQVINDCIWCAFEVISQHYALGTVFKLLQNIENNPSDINPVHIKRLTSPD